MWYYGYIHRKSDSNIMINLIIILFFNNPSVLESFNGTIHSMNTIGKQKELFGMKKVSSDFSIILDSKVTLNKEEYFSSVFDSAIVFSGSSLLISSCMFHDIPSSAVCFNHPTSDVTLKYSVFIKCESNDSGGGALVYSNDCLISFCCFETCKCSYDSKWGSAAYINCQRNINASMISALNCPKAPLISWEITLYLIGKVTTSNDLNFSECSHNYIGGLTTKNTEYSLSQYIHTQNMNSQFSIGFWIQSGSHLANYHNFHNLSNSLGVIRSILSELVFHNSIFSNCIGRITSYLPGQTGYITLKDCSFDKSTDLGYAVRTTQNLVYFPLNRSLIPLSIYEPYLMCGTLKSTLQYNKYPRLVAVFYQVMLLP